MDLINNVDLVARLARGELCILNDLFANVIDPRLGCGVHLDHIHTRAAADTYAQLARAAWVGRRSVTRYAIERLREQACRGGLTTAARAAEQIGMANPSPSDGVLQYHGDVVLAHDFAKAL